MFFKNIKKTNQTAGILEKTIFSLNTMLRTLVLEVRLCVLSYVFVLKNHFAKVAALNDVKINDSVWLCELQKPWRLPVIEKVDDIFIEY